MWWSAAQLSLCCFTMKETWHVMRVSVSLSLLKHDHTSFRPLITFCSLSTRWRASSQSSSCAPVFTPPCFASESSTTTTWPPTTRPTPTASSSAACKWQQECFYFERILKGTCSGKIAVNQEKTWAHMFLSRMFLLIYKKNICTVSKNLKLLNFNTCSVERISSLSS